MAEDRINVAAVDRYTSAHAGMGALMARMHMPWWAALAGSVAWEVAENGVKHRYPELFPYSSPDTWQNASMDTVAVLLGYAFTTYAMAEGLTTRGQTALDAAVGATVGGALGSVAFGLAKGRGAEQDISYARRGYRVGGALGGATGAMLGAHGPISAAGAAVGGGLIGPVGAALGGYLTGGIFRDQNPELDGPEPYEEYL